MRSSRGLLFKLLHPHPPDVFAHKHRIRMSFSRSSGKGGQNVNKVSTKVELRIPLVPTPEWLPRDLCERLAEQQKGRVNVDGELIVVSQRHRTQVQNIDDALSKLQDMVRSANEVPDERLQTEVPEWTRKTRLEEKRIKSTKKSLRRAPSDY